MGRSFVAGAVAEAFSCGDRESVAAELAYSNGMLIDQFNTARRSSETKAKAGYEHEYLFGGTASYFRRTPNGRVAILSRFFTRG
jgi:hypothetical protein